MSRSDEDMSMTELYLQSNYHLLHPGDIPEVIKKNGSIKRGIINNIYDIVTDTDNKITSFTIDMVIGGKTKIIKAINIKKINNYSARRFLDELLFEGVISPTKRKKGGFYRGSVKMDRKGPPTRHRNKDFKKRSSSRCSKRRRR